MNKPNFDLPYKADIFQADSSSSLGCADDIKQARIDFLLTANDVIADQRDHLRVEIANYTASLTNNDDAYDEKACASLETAFKLGCARMHERYLLALDMAFYAEYFDLIEGNTSS